VITKVCFHKLIASSTGTGKKHCPSSPSRGVYVGWNPTGSSKKRRHRFDSCLLPLNGAVV